MNANDYRKAIWIDGVLYVPVLDTEILAALDRPAPSDGLRTSQPGMLRIKELTRSIAIGDHSMRLTRTELALLSRLVASQGEAVEADCILRDVWGVVPATKGRELLRTHIRNVRTKLRAVGVPDDALSSVRGLGYRFRFNVDLCRQEQNAFLSRLG